MSVASPQSPVHRATPYGSTPRRTPRCRCPRAKRASPRRRRVPGSEATVPAAQARSCWRVSASSS